MAAERIVLLTDAGMEAHAAPGHPERPERLRPVAAGVEAAARDVGARLERRACSQARDDEIERVHPAWHLAALDEAARDGGEWLDADTYLGPRSMVAARLAAGGTIAAARMASSGEARLAFAVVRPPGHHAAADRASGFCLLNNVAIAVAALRAEALAQRIVIVDWDVHHGDGTQAIFDADPALFYASTHQSPLYPGTGARDEVGSGAAAGTKQNRPLPPGSGDRSFVAAWLEDLLPAVETFEPEAILVSAGYDGHRNDPLAHLDISEDGFEMVAGALGALVARLGLPGVCLTLEGGYDTDALRASASATVRGLLDGLAGGRSA